MKSDVYNKEGKRVGAIVLPEVVFAVPWNNELIHQVVTSMEANARTPVAHTKFRGEVRGGGKKPWKQKGTGRARHGSIRSPIWRGGGVTHGPRAEKNYSRAIPKKMRARALAVALSQKARDGEIIFVDSLSITAPKTSEARGILIALSKISGFEKLATKRKNAALVAFSEKRVATEKSFRNFGNVFCTEARNLNPLSVLKYTYLVIENPNVSLPVLENKFPKKHSDHKSEVKS